jgi:hypothetical protein
MRTDLRDLVVHRRLDALAETAAASRRVLGRLVSLTYDADPAVAWAAVEAMGAAAARIADDDPDFVRHHLRRLHWLLQEESGGICWYAPQAMAEIVARRPDLFADYVPIVVNLVLEMAEEDLEHFRAGMLWAVGRLGALARSEAADVVPSAVEALGHPDAQVRGTAVWCLGRLGHTAEVEARKGLQDDDGPCTLFLDGELRALTVARVAQVVRAAAATAAVPGGEAHT